LPAYAGRLQASEGARPEAHCGRRLRAIGNLVAAVNRMNSRENRSTVGRLMCKSLKAFGGKGGTRIVRHPQLNQQLDDFSRVLSPGSPPESRICQQICQWRGAADTQDRSLMERFLRSVLSTLIGLCGLGIPARSSAALNRSSQRQYRLAIVATVGLPVRLPAQQGEGHRDIKFPSQGVE